MVSLLRRDCAQRSRRPRGARPGLEAVESRLVPAPLMPLAAGPAAIVAAAPTIQPMPVSAVAVNAAGTPSSVHPAAWSQSSPWGFAPQQLATAYGFNSLSFGSISATGAGQTIAIVDAYDDPALVDSNAANFAASDLARFDQQYGLPDPPSFVKLNENGGSALPGVDPAGAGMPGDWEEEEAMDVEWAHAMAPGASIVLIECASDSSADLYQGVRTAAALPGVSVVSMSWGSAEYAGETGYDGVFTTPAGHPGVVFVASTGDQGAPGIYPAFSPNVLAVGGTTLTLSAGGGYGSESGWSNGGGGTSLYEPEPAFQKTVQATGQRTIPDVAFVANPQTGASVYDSYDDVNGDGPWMRTGGTSLAAPAWAALVAIADQRRVAAGGSTLNGASEVLPALYALPESDFHDVTTGGNGAYQAGPGYDQSTGLGTPQAGLIGPALAYDNLAPWLAISTAPPSVVTAGQTFNMTVEVQNPDGSLDTGFLGTVTIGLDGPPAGAALGGDLTVPVVGGYASFTGLTLTQAADGYRIVAASQEGPASAMTSPFQVVPSAPAQLEVAPAPTSGGVSVTVVDGYGNVETTYTGSVTVRWGGNSRSSRAARFRHDRFLGTASAGVVTFEHLERAAKARRLVLQASADGLTTSAVLGRSGKAMVLVKPEQGRGQARQAPGHRRAR